MALRGLAADLVGREPASAKPTARQALAPPNQPPNATRQTPSLLGFQAMMPEKIHELLIVVRSYIEEDAHPTIAAPGC
jgi:hypothetical protein